MTRYRWISRRVRTAHRRWMGAFMRCAVRTLLVFATAAQAASQADLESLFADFHGEAAVYAKDLSTGREVAINADKSFYLASVAKVFIMASVYDKLEREGLTREHVLPFTPEDYREKTRTLRDRYGEKWTVQHVIDPMINVSDTAATDLLVKFVGEDQVNAFVKSLGIPGIGRITSIGHLDREIMTRIDSRFAEVPYHLLERWQRGGEVAAIVPAYFPTDPRTLPAYRLRYGAAYRDYYATGWNSATPRAMGAVLERIARGTLVSATSSRWMMETMGNSGGPRMGRRLPPTTWTYSKDGGKYQVTCSVGIIREGTFEMLVGAFTQKCDRDNGGDVVSRAAEIAYAMLRPASLKVTPPAATPEKLSPVYLMTDAQHRAILQEHGKDYAALVNARRAVHGTDIASATLVRAALASDHLAADLPLVFAAEGPGDYRVRYQSTLRAGQVSNWAPGFTVRRPGQYRVGFYQQGTLVRSATFTVTR